MYLLSLVGLNSEITKKVPETIQLGNLLHRHYTNATACTSDRKINMLSLFLLHLIIFIVQIVLCDFLKKFNNDPIILGMKAASIEFSVEIWQ
jgi:hypothetical protein